MSRAGKYFPVIFVLPFLLATTDLDLLKQTSEVFRWVVLFVALGWAFSKTFSSGFRHESGILTPDVIIVAVLIYFSVSTVWSIAPAYSFQRTVSLGLLYIATFWCFWHYVDQRGEERLLQLFLRTSGIVLGVNIVIFGVLSSGDVLALRFQGFFANPNNLGLICSLSLPLSLAAVFKRPGKFEWVLFGIFTASLLACGSRTGLVASGIGMFIIGALRVIRGNRLALLFGVLVIVFLGVLSASRFFDEKVLRIDSLSTLSDRTFFWELAKEEYIRARPLLGHGFGADNLIHDYYGIVLEDVNLRGYGVASSYYGLAVSVGVPGAILFCLLIASAPLVALVRFRRNPQIVTLAATVVAGLLVGITESAIFSAGNCFAYLFWTVFALLIRRLVYQNRRIRLTRQGALLTRQGALRGRKRRGVPGFAGSKKSGVGWRRALQLTRNTVSFLGRNENSSHSSNS